MIIFSTIDVEKSSFGLSQSTAMNQSNGMCGMDCLEFPENLRGSECVDCSKFIAEQDLEEMNKHKQNIITAANETCFDPALLAAFISRQTRGGSELAGTDGWIPCHNDPDQQCFGIMHMADCKFMRSIGKINFY